MITRSVVGALALVLTFAFAFEVEAQELSDTSWHLVKIMSMDDSTDTPDDPSIYTLNFQPNGRASIRADCNRGTGSWTSESGSQLRFGPIASTRALCPPGSLSDKYLAQFESVRSYVLENGHLFLATIADGSIIEFEPVGEVTATVYGEAISTSDASQMQEAILTRLFDRFAAESGIEAQAAEVEAYLEKMRSGMSAERLADDENLTAEEAEQVETLRRNMARSMVRQWKINKALYDKYGGRIIYQQLGPEPLDAFRQFIEERQGKGEFAIQDPILMEEFWRYFKDESIHDFMPPGSEDEARAFKTPPWE